MSMGQLRSAQATLAAPPPGRDGAHLARPAHAWRRALERACDLLLTWQERAHQRHSLEALSDHMLRDIGLSRADVMAETTKPFWQR